MKLSSLKDGQAGRFSEDVEDPYVKKGQRFIVVDRVPEDRSSGITTVRVEQGYEAVFIWDHSNPLVECIGTSKVKIELTFDDDHLGKET